MFAYGAFSSKKSQIRQKTVVGLAYKLSKISERKSLIRAEFRKAFLLIVVAVQYY
jgi:hypothetical protein